MNLLKEHFDIAVETPDGIAKLRSLILTLAAQGKLVAQDHKDQSATELLKSIKARKKTLIEEGKIKNGDVLPPISPDDLPYQLPEGWDWVRLGEIAQYNGRVNAEPNEISPETWVLDLEDIEKDTSRILTRARYSDRQSKSTKSTFVKGDVLYGKLRPYLNKVVVADQDGVCTTEIVPIVPFEGVDPYFLRYLLKRPSFISYVNGLSYGVKMPRLGTSAAVMSIHPLAPAGEQKRIVAKIDQLMALCDRLEALRNERDRKRLSVHSSAISGLLGAPDNSGFNKSWSFITKHFSELYSVTENVAELKKAILQLAVMGKLVPQDPNDQPASELLKEIEAEKKRLVKEGKIKEQKPLPPIKEEEIPYEAPSGWVWTRLGEFGTWKSGSTPSRTVKSYYGGGIPWVKSGEVKQRRIREASETITDNALKECPLSLNPVGSVLIAMYGANIGEVGILEIEATTNQAVCACKTYADIDKNFLLNLVDAMKPSFIAQGAGAAQPNISREKIVNALALLPPLKEQKRIVAKIDQLMSLADKLDEHLSSASAKRAAILDALPARV